MKYAWRLVVAVLMVFMVSGAVSAKEWKGDFDRLCGYTQDAHQYTIDELKGFIGECDELREVIASSENPRKKVALFRLKKCRNFFDYMVSIREIAAEKGK